MLARSAPVRTAGALAAGAVLWPASRISRIPALAHAADVAVLVPSVIAGALGRARALGGSS